MTNIGKQLLKFRCAYVIKNAPVLNSPDTINQNIQATLMLTITSTVPSSRFRIRWDQQLRHRHASSSRCSYLHHSFRTDHKPVAKNGHKINKKTPRFVEVVFIVENTLKTES